MSESRQIVDLILNDQYSLQSAFAISNHIQQVKHQRMSTLFEQLQSPPKIMENQKSGLGKWFTLQWI